MKFHTAERCQEIVDDILASGGEPKVIELTKYYALYVEAYREHLKNQESLLLHFLTLIEGVGMREMANLYDNGFETPKEVAQVANFSKEEQEKFYKELVTPFKKADGSPCAVDKFPVRKARLLNLIEKCIDVASSSQKTKVGSNEESKQTSMGEIIDPVSKECSFDKYGEYLKQWQKDHFGVPLAEALRPTKMLLAHLIKMKRVGDWEPVSLNYCHAKDSRQFKNPSKSLFDSTTLTLQGGQLQQVSKIDEQKKQVTPENFLTCLEILKVAYHMVGIVNENVFQLHIQDLKTKMTEYPQHVQKIMKADRVIRQKWTQHQQEKEVSLEAAVKVFSVPDSELRVSMWTEILYVNRETTIVNNTYGGYMGGGNVNTPPQGNKRGTNFGRPLPAKSPKNTKTMSPSKANPPKKTYPFVFEKGGQKLCQFNAWKGDCRRGETCPFSHSCLHKDCSITEKHVCAQAHAKEWADVFGDSNPSVFFKGAGKGGKGSKGKGKGRNR